MKKIYTIGRDEGCDIVIPDPTDVISRLHATLRVESHDKIFLIDQSRNGTYVNGMKMSSNVEIPISRKDVVSFAHIYNLDWSLVPKQKNPVLKNIFVMLFSLVVLTGGTYAVISYLNNKGESPAPPAPPEEQIIPPVEEETMTPDTVVVRDTVVVDIKDKPKTKEERKDSIKAENPNEEIYNPIY